MFFSELLIGTFAGHPQELFFGRQNEPKGCQKEPKWNPKRCQNYAKLSPPSQSIQANPSYRFNKPAQIKQFIFLVSRNCYFGIRVPVYLGSLRYHLISNLVVLNFILFRSDTR
jgi:hypothetical protein